MDLKHVLPHSTVLAVCLTLGAWPVTAEGPDERSVETADSTGLNSTFREVHRLQGHWDDINDVTISPDGRFAATTSNDSSLIVWNTSDGSQKFSVKYKAGTSITDKHIVMAATFSPDSKRIFSASYQTERWGDMRLHSLKKGKQEWRWGIAPGIASLDFSPNGEHVAIGFLMGQFSAQNMHIKNTLKGKKKRRHVTLEGHRDMVGSVQFSPDGGQIVTTSLDGNMVVWDAGAGHRKFGVKFEGVLEDAVFTADSNFIAATAGGEIKILDARNGKVIRVIDRNFDKYELFLDLAAHPDGKTVAAASTNGSVFMFDTSSGKLTSQILDAHTDQVSSVEFSQDGAMLISGSFDDTAIIWQKQ